MARAFLFVLDSFGIGNAPDAQAFGDQGADTFGHIRSACLAGAGDSLDLRSGPLAVPNMDRLGLSHAWAIANDRPLPDFSAQGFFGAASEISSGKDTPSGHWEMASFPARFDWGYFPNSQPAIPQSITDQLIQEAGLSGLLGNRHAAGTEVLDLYGEDHLQSLKPIIYTSVDSVLQIAAHEERFGLERLYQTCEIARRLVDPLNIGRVIARPFKGETAETFERTANRRDYAIPPMQPTLLDRLQEAGRKTIGIGKIGDIFAHRGLSENRKGFGNMALFDASLGAMDDARDGDLVFANFVDFDTLYGHRRDVPGYASCLEEFDQRLPEAIARLRDGDMLILTADHGCDPTWRGTDHTRERVPIIGTGPGLKSGPIGLRDTYADIGETIAAHLGLKSGPVGRSFLNEIAINA